MRQKVAEQRSKSNAALGCAQNLADETASEGKDDAGNSASQDADPQERRHVQELLPGFELRLHNA